MDSCSDQCIGTGRRAALMRVRFEIDIKRPAARLRARGFESEHLRVFQAAVGIYSCTDLVAMRVGNHSADIRIGGSETDPLAREFESAVKKLFVGGVGGHVGKEIYHANRAGSLAG